MILSTLLKALDQMGMVKQANAHCDIPCGVYDTGPALVAAASVVRLMDILDQSKNDNASALSNQHTRLIAEKEKQAEIVKHEIRVIWGDYFKAPLIEKHPDIHALVHSIMQKGSACKQGIHREDGVALIELVNQFAEIFWETKGLTTARGPCPYEPKLPVVYPVLAG